MPSHAHLKFFLKKCRVVAFITVKNVGAVTLSRQKVKIDGVERRVYNSNHRTIPVPGTHFSLVGVRFKYVNVNGDEAPEPDLVKLPVINLAQLEVTITNDPPGADPPTSITVAEDETNPQSEPGDDPT